MPILAVVLVIGLSLISHLLRGVNVSLATNIGISALVYCVIMTMGALRFGMSSDFWGDIFVVVVYCVVGTIELYELLAGMYEVVSPFAMDESVEELEPRG